MKATEIHIGPNDGLNPGFGYYIKVEVNGDIVLNTNKHPVTGKDLTLRSAIEVANMYNDGSL